MQSTLIKISFTILSSWLAICFMLLFNTIIPRVSISSFNVILFGFKYTFAILVSSYWFSKIDNTAFISYIKRISFLLTLILFMYPDLNSRLFSMLIFLIATLIDNNRVQNYVSSIVR